MTAYAAVADKIIGLISSGALKAGDKLPSLRELSQELSVSLNTVKEAYWRLEDRHYVEAVPQSGYYVRVAVRPRIDGAPPAIDLDPTKVSLCRVYSSFASEKRQDDEGLSLGIASTPLGSLSAEKLGRYVRDALKEEPEAAFDYCMPPGYLPLREMISRHSLSARAELGPDDLVITNGAHESVFLALMAICEPGDSVAVESPMCYNFLSLLQRLKLRAIEIPSDATRGMNLDILKFVLDNQSVKAVFSIPNFSNPLGALMPEQDKRALVELVSARGVPLIEDDVYGDLSFSARPGCCKGYDRDGMVIHCSSFSKSIGPGLRLGWIAPGRYLDDVIRVKTLMNLGTSSITQMALARFLADGAYERYLRGIRKRLGESVNSVRTRVLELFPAGTSVSEPSGGFVLWITLPGQADSLELYHRALERRILIAPGCLFTLKDQYASSFRINGGLMNPRVDECLRELARLCRTDG
jgi:DNA-binding transcriptional MocR family regulator